MASRRDSAGGECTCGYIPSGYCPGRGREFFKAGKSRAVIWRSSLCAPGTIGPSSSQPADQPNRDEKPPEFLVDCKLPTLVKPMVIGDTGLALTGGLHRQQSQAVNGGWKWVVSQLGEQRRPVGLRARTRPEEAGLITGSPISPFF
jgi:hypothetical protein